MDCGEIRYQYFSCGNNQCPQCQGVKRLQWQDRLSSKMLKVPYVHTTFTLPHALNGLARRNRGKIYGLLLRSCWKTIEKLCKKETNVGAKPGMTAVMHTWGSDLKYHIHAHCLVTFGGLVLHPSPEWKWPKRKKKLAGYRAICGTFRQVFLKGLEGLMKRGEVIYHRSYEELEKEMLKIRWVVHNTHPSSDTKVIEEYLSRYICRIGITNSRLSYDPTGRNVQIKYNDYRNQKKGYPAPKKYKSLPPFLGMHMILQHQVPVGFQRVRHYGLHFGVTYKRIKDQIPDHLRRNGQTVRTIIQILKALLGEEPYKCEGCEGLDFEEDLIVADPDYIVRMLCRKKRGPPGKRAGAEGIN